MLQQPINRPYVVFVTDATTSNDQLERQTKYPIRKAHYVGSSVVLTLDPTHVKRLSIDEMTFFIQKPVENGIILEKRRLNTEQENLETGRIGEGGFTKEQNKIIIEKA
jgi:hypothetical protein